MKAIVYARFSSDNQREESITAQLRAIHDYAEKHNVIIIKEYIDEAKSATTDDRPGFLSMFEDIALEKVKPDFLYVHKLDRFARNRYDSAFYKRKLTQHKIKLLAVAQPLDDSPESIILEGMLEAMAEYYSKNLAREVQKGMYETAIQGKHTGGIPPLGYDVGPNKKLIINEREAEAVRLIYQLTLEGVGYSFIINELNRHDYKTKYGKPFGKNSIYEILRNEKYAGVYVFNKSSSAILGQRNNHSQKNDSDIVRIPGAIPTIISPEKWAEVQKILETRRQVSPRRRSDVIYILTGKVVCGECGGAMVGSNAVAGRDKKRYYFYTCNAKKRTKQCDNKDIRKEVLENLVLDKIESKFSPELIEVWAEKLEQHYIQQNEEYQKEKGHLEQNLKNVSERIERILDAIETGAMVPNVAGSRINSLSKEKDEIEERLRVLEFSNKIPLNKKMIIDYLKRNHQTIKNRESLEDCKIITDMYLINVVVYKDHIETNIKLEVISDSNGGGGGS